MTAPAELTPAKQISASERGPVRCLAFSPDGRTLAVGSSFAVWLYDAETGAQRNRFRAWEVQALAFSPDGKTLAAALDMGLCNAVGC